MADQIHAYDIGTIFQFEVQEDDVAVDISAATAIAFYFGSPTGLTKTKVGAFVNDGTDGLIKYTTVSGDLDEVGPWQVQAKVDLPAWQGHTEIVNFTVYPNIVDPP